MSVYAISDLHLSLGVGSSKAMDIFNGWENYLDKLEKNWQNTVKKADTVIIAGDISWAKNLEETYKDFNFLNNLNGNKILIKGNHDYWWESKSKVNKFLEENKFNSIRILFNDSIEVENFTICGTRGWLIDSTIEEDKKILKREIGRLELSLKSSKNNDLEKIVFFHYPPITLKGHCKEIIEILIKNDIKKCFYGHIHGKTNKSFLGNYKNINFSLISCDFLGFSPLLIN